MKMFAEMTPRQNRQPHAGESHRSQIVTSPLSRVRAGTRVRIKSLSAPPAVSQRLREMGLGENQEIRVLVRQSNLICLVANARMALSSQLAQMILVEPLMITGSQEF